MASRKAAASEKARHTLRYVESLSDVRTPLADFFSLLLRLYGSFFREQDRIFHSRLTILQRHTLLRNRFHHNMIFYSFSHPDDMDVVILREHRQLTLLPPLLLHAHEPEIVELGQPVKGRLLVLCLLQPRIELRLVCAGNFRVISAGRGKDIARRREVISR